MVTLSDLYKCKQELILLRPVAVIIPDRLLDPARQAAGLGKTRASHGSPSTACYSDVTPTQAGSSLSTDLTETAGQSGGPALVVGFDEKWLIQVEQADVVCQSRSH